MIHPQELPCIRCGVNTRRHCGNPDCEWRICDPHHGGCGFVHDTRFDDTHGFYVGIPREKSQPDVP